jgi:hypothetical protein
MRATISRKYREGNTSVYSEDITHLWQEFLDKVPFEFYEDRDVHRAYANGFIQAKFGSDAQIFVEFS